MNTGIEIFPRETGGYAYKSLNRNLGFFIMNYFRMEYIIMIDIYIYIIIPLSHYYRN